MKIVGSKVTRTYGYRIYNLELIIYSYNKKNYNYNQIVSYDILDNSSLIFFCGNEWSEKYISSCDYRLL